MTFSSSRQKVKWVTLISAFVFLGLDSYCRRYCYQIIIGSGKNGPVPFKIDNSPKGFMVLWVCVLCLTLLSALIALPRWQSFLALMVVGLVTFLWFYS